jgi:hypothetical protein
MYMMYIGLYLLLQELINIPAFLRIPIPNLIDILHHILTQSKSIYEFGLETAENYLVFGLA